MITIIDVDKFIKENKLSGPVTSSQIFIGSKSFEYHPQGVYSEDIFGLEGSRERSEKMSWIDLNCYVINPILFDLISKRIERKISDAISGTESFNIDERLGLVPSENNKGIITGLSSLVKNIDKLRFRDDGTSEDRTKLINILYENIKRGTFFTDKLLVISPSFRPITINEEKNESVEESGGLSPLYRKIISLSGQLKAVSGGLFDILSYRMQLMLRDVFEVVREKVSKKSGMIRSLMLGKRVDFSARAVVSPNPELHPSEVGIPLRIAIQIFEPFVLYGLFNSPYANRIPEEFHIEAKKFLGKESTFNLEG